MNDSLSNMILGYGSPPCSDRDVLDLAVKVAPVRLPRTKSIYYMCSPEVVPASVLWPHRTDTDGVEVLVCQVLRDDGTTYECRTSKLVNVNLITGTYETLNSIYQLRK